MKIIEKNKDGVGDFFYYPTSFLILILAVFVIAIGGLAVSELKMYKAHYNQAVELYAENLRIIDESVDEESALDTAYDELDRFKGKSSISAVNDNLKAFNTILKVSPERLEKEDMDMYMTIDAYSR